MICQENTKFTAANGIIDSVNGSYRIEHLIGDIDEDTNVQQLVVSRTDDPQLYEILNYAVYPSSCNDLHKAHEMIGAYDVVYRLCEIEPQSLNTIIKLVKPVPDPEGYYDTGFAKKEAPNTSTESGTLKEFIPEPPRSEEGYTSLIDARDFLEKAFQFHEGSYTIPVQFNLHGIVFDHRETVSEGDMINLTKIQAIKFIRAGGLYYK